MCSNGKSLKDTTQTRTHTHIHSYKQTDTQRDRQTHTHPQQVQDERSFSTLLCCEPYNTVAIRRACFELPGGRMREQLQQVVLGDYHCAYERKLLGDD